jgi:hypothetical protein
MQMAGMRSVPATKVLQKLRGGREGCRAGGRAEVHSEDLHDFQTEGDAQRDEHDERDDFRHVGGQDVSDALLQVVEDQTAFRDALQRVGKGAAEKRAKAQQQHAHSHFDDGREVVVHEDDVSGLFGHVAAGNTHRDACNERYRRRSCFTRQAAAITCVRFFESGRVVDAVTSHRDLKTENVSEWVARVGVVHARYQVIPANFALHFRDNVLLLLRQRASEYYVPGNRHQRPHCCNAHEQTHCQFVDFALAAENVTPVAFGKCREQVPRRYDALDLPEKSARTRRSRATSRHLLHQVVIGENGLFAATSLQRKLINGETGHDVDAAGDGARSDGVVPWLVTWSVSR